MKNIASRDKSSPLLSILIRKEVVVFLEVARSESISAAAPQLNLHQPAISKALKRLETELKTTLFSRSRNGIKLTHEGLELQTTLLKLSELWKSEQENEKIRHLTLGCHQSIAIEFFPTFITHVRTLFSGTEFAFKLLPSLQVTEKVSHLEIDLGIVVNPVKSRQIIAKPIRQDYISYWAKTSTDGLDPNFKNAPILVHPDMLYASRIRSTAAEVLQIPDYEVISAMVKTGFFIGILPATVASRHGLKQIDKKLFTVDISLIFHEDRFDRETAKKILRLFGE